MTVPTAFPLITGPSWRPGRRTARENAESVAPVRTFREDAGVDDELEQLTAAFERFEATKRRADDRLAGYAAVKDRIAEIEATAQSPDRGVTVVAGPGGAVKDLRFTPQALQQGPSALAAAALSAMRVAVAAAARKQAAVVQEFVGDDMNVLDQVLQTQAELLGTTVEELRRQDEPEPGWGNQPPIGGTATPAAPSETPRAQPRRPAAGSDGPDEEGGGYGFQYDQRGF